MKLNDVYITWKDGELEVMPKAHGVPHNVDDFFDPSLWDQSNLGGLFLQWFATFTLGLWDVGKMNCPGQVWEELSSIEEFDALDSRRLHKKYDSDHHDGYCGDTAFILRHFVSPHDPAVTVDQ